MYGNVIPVWRAGAPVEGNVPTFAVILEPAMVVDAFTGDAFLGAQWGNKPITVRIC